MKKFAPFALGVLLAVVLIIPLGAAATLPASASVPHYNACSSGRHLETGLTYTLPGDGSFKFTMFVQSWLDSGGNYCGVKQPVMHSWQTEGIPFAGDEAMRHQDIGIWRGSTNLGTWGWDCPSGQTCVLKDNWWYGPDIHNVACTDGLYAYGSVWEQGGLGEWRYGQIYTSDYESTSGPSLTMNFC